MQQHAQMRFTQRLTNTEQQPDPACTSPGLKKLSMTSILGEWDSSTASSWRAGSGLLGETTPL